MHTWKWCCTPQESHTSGFCISHRWPGNRLSFSVFGSTLNRISQNMAGSNKIMANSLIFILQLPHKYITVAKIQLSLQPRFDLLHLGLGSCVLYHSIRILANSMSYSHIYLSEPYETAANVSVSVNGLPFLKKFSMHSVKKL